MKIQYSIILPITLLFTVCLADKEATDVNPDRIEQAVISTMGEWSDGKLAKEKWPEALSELDPIEIYSDRVNAVIVLSRGYGIETGIYVCVPISSYRPTDGDGWKFTPMVDGAWDVLRCTRNIGESGRREH